MENRVIQSRVRLARNLAAHPFPPAMTKDLSNTVTELSLLWLKSLQSSFDFQVVKLNELSIEKRLELFHRYLISSDFLDNTLTRTLALSKDETLSLMVNEEDHFRIQSLKPGYQLWSAFNDAVKVHRLLEAHFELAFHKKLGYLTACTTNVGTGMRASVQLHLPGITLSKDADHMVQTLTNLGIELRGTYGERSEVFGDVYQVSNKKTLGLSEEQILKELDHVVQMLLQAEDLARHRYVIDNVQMVDKIHRAIGIIQYARYLGHKESYDLLSLLRMGSELGYEGFPDVLYIDEGLKFLKNQSVFDFMAKEDIRGAERALGLKRLLFR